MNTDRVLLDGGPMHGVRDLIVDIREFALMWNDRAGSYRQVGRTEAGFRIFKWRWM